MIKSNVYIFDSEVFAHDWFFVFKEKETKKYYKFHNEYEGIQEFMKLNPILAGFNNKGYDQFILKAILMNKTPEEVKKVNDHIIGGGKGWELPEMKKSKKILQYDLMDDCQMGLSLKAIEAHLMMDIRETTVSFDKEHLTEEEIEEIFFYCTHDVDATDILDDMRQDYLDTKIQLAKEKGIGQIFALAQTNGKLTAMYLDAKKPEKPWKDEREYEYPKTLLREYIPQEVFDFFDRFRDTRIPFSEIRESHLEINVGGCPVTLGLGGIHGAIPRYQEEATENRFIRNKDVASYYPHQMTVNGYCSRNIPSPKIYADTIERRVRAKKSGDKATANALKLVLNTAYGVMLNEYSDMYDPKMGRSVCISGQLQLLELACHCLAECKTMKIIQLNTDGIMVSFDKCDEAKWQEITQEWQDRTGFELEEDTVEKIVQKDVNNYVEVGSEGLKIKGGMLVRGVSKAGAFNVNNNAVVVANALRDYLAFGKPIEQTVREDNDISHYMLIAKASSKYSESLHWFDGRWEKVQKVNRVYASHDLKNGCLCKVHKQTGSIEKIPNLPMCCVIDNDNQLSIKDVSKNWYIQLAKEQASQFLGIDNKISKESRKKIRDSAKKISEVVRCMYE